jgi:protein phosphatase PTC6
MPLTSGDHHPGNPLEHERLRKYAGFVTTDSWGDDRIMGMLATSRAFGDSKLKRYGVSAEPDVIRHTITKDNPAAFMVCKKKRGRDPGNGYCCLMLLLL